MDLKQKQSIEPILKAFFEGDAKAGFIERIKTFLAEDFTKNTIRDFVRFLEDYHKIRKTKPTFDLMEFLPDIVREVGAVQVEAVKLYTKFLSEEAEKTLNQKIRIS